MFWYWFHTWSADGLPADAAGDVPGIFPFLNYLMYALVEKIEIVLEFVCFFSFLFFFLLQISMQESGPVCVSFRLFINNAIITIFFFGG